jgi:outer membrane protein OmpA-like peptidoglycan-associated protein
MIIPETAARRLLCVFIAACVGASGCYITDAFTGEQRVGSTTKGAAIGAAVGAAAGLLTGDDSRDRRKRALIGAGIGALSGGAIGRYMDVQEARLRERLAGTGVSVQREGNEIQLVMPANVTFATDQADLRPEFFDVLNSVAVVLQEYDRTLVDVVGHTDSTGSEAHNQVLSEARAEAVAEYLRAQGIDDARIGTAGAGESLPLTTNATPEDRQQNRRVELDLVPLTS